CRHHPERGDPVFPCPEQIAVTTGCPAFAGHDGLASKFPGASQDLALRKAWTYKGLDLQRALDRLYAIALDHVADTHVAVVLEGHAAFLAGLHFFHFILEAFQRR